MAIRDDRSKYTHFNVASRWRIWAIDEPGDVVLGIDYLDAPHPQGKWHNVARLDESKHDSFHAHLPSDMEVRIPLGKGLSREDKIKLGLRELARFAAEGKIFQGKDIMQSAEVWQALGSQILEERAPLGNTHHNVSITGTARIVGSLETKKIDKE